MGLSYRSLVGFQEGARRLHVHITEIPDTSSHHSYQHKHKAEEAFYILDGSAEYMYAGKTIKAGPGDVVFMPSGVEHADIRYLSPSMRYLTIRSVEEDDEPCCCGQDRDPTATE